MKRMPSPPLSVCPVVSGMSDAVIPMRSVPWALAAGPLAMKMAAKIPAKARFMIRFRIVSEPDAWFARRVPLRPSWERRRAPLDHQSTESGPEADMSYAYLAIAILAEVIGTSALKASAGFTRLGPSVAVAAGFAAAFFFLSLALRTIPMGIAYAIWGGCGLTLIVIIGAVLFREIPDFGAVIGFALIGAGVVALTLSSRMVVH